MVKCIFSVKKVQNKVCMWIGVVVCSQIFCSKSFFRERKRAVVIGQRLCEILIGQWAHYLLMLLFRPKLDFSGEMIPAENDEFV